jgi:hypothetical protein
MIKSFSQFIKEEISGTEIPQKTKGSYFGPAYGDAESPNTVNKFHTNVVASNSDNPNSNNPLTSNIFSYEDLEELYHNYLKLGGSLSELSGDKSQDIAIMTDYLNNR